MTVTCTQSQSSNVVIEIPFFQELQYDINSITTSQGSVFNPTSTTFTINVGTMNPGNVVSISYNASYITTYNSAAPISSIAFTWEAHSCSGKLN
jgi:hypothetical protein